MLKVLLVDDEKLVLNSLVNHIDWENMDISIAGTARNGRDALEKVHELRPNVIMTDIKMPIMDGIEFSKKALEFDSNIKIIFLTGHDEFQYAKSAVNIGVYGYILKPVDQDELFNVIEKVKLKCNADNYSSMTVENIKQSYFKQLLFEKSADKVEKIISEIGKLEGKMSYLHKSEVYSAVICVDNYYIATKNMDSNSIEKMNNLILSDINKWLGACPEPFFAISLEDGKVCIIISEKHCLAADFGVEWKLIRENIEHSHRITLSIGICDKKGSLEKIPELYVLASKAISNKFYYGKSQVIISSKLKDKSTENVPELKDMEVELIDAIYKANKEQIYTIVDRYFEILCFKGVERNIINVSIYNLLNSIYEYFMKRDKDIYTILSEKSSILDNVLAFDNIVSIKEYLMDMLGSIMNYFEDGRESTHVINKIIKVLKANYNKVITADDLAREIYLTPNYIRTIFKKYTGETILEYHTKMRMERAKELLGDRSQKIYDISNMVGYENTSYFCSLFSKYYGMTPNEYRKKIL